jgi:hypothetical protein
MPTPTERELFDLLSDDASRARLDAPADLRRRADRRTATRAALGSVAVVAVVAAAFLAGRPLTDRSTAPDVVDTPPPTSTAVPTPTPTSQSPSVSEAPTPATVPDRAWLDSGDLRSGEDMVDAESEVVAPCGSPLLGGSLLSDPVSMETRNGFYRAPDVPMDYTPDGTISQTIAVFDSVQARNMTMQHLGSAISACPEDTSPGREGIRYSWLEVHGNVSILEISAPGVSVSGGPPNPARVRSYLASTFAGNVVTFLTLRGWEASDTDLADVRRLSNLATERLSGQNG